MKVLKLKKLKNISAEKLLQNTKFKEDIDNNHYLTQNPWRKFGLSSSKLPQKWTGNKMINMDNLNDSLKLWVLQIFTLRKDLDQNQN